jgi:hypothetical protein
VSATPEHVSDSYSYRPSVLGAPWEFRLTGDGIEWVAGRKSGRMAFRDVRCVRLSFRPANMQSHRFMTELWADGVPKLRIMSSSWKSMVEQVRLDAPYSAFIAELHRRIAQAGAPVAYEQGTHPLLYWPGVIVFAAMLLALAMLIVRAVQAGAIGGAVFIAVFGALFVWRGGNFLRRNRPGAYRPDALPAQLMPQGGRSEVFGSGGV